MFTPKVATSTMAKDLASSPFAEASANSEDQFYAPSRATVTFVDYAKLEVTLKVTDGEIFQHIPIALTFPGAGARHFLGALPMVGDVCLVAWGPLESGKTRQPYVVAWFVPGVTAGTDWWASQPMSQDEFTMTPAEQIRWKGIVDRRRHKLRQMRPGNVVASSAQGADLVLNEGVLLADRRGGEIRLRDQDGSLILRSLQQFHAMSGARVYAGMVQRDATLLPSAVTSDGRAWDQPTQLDVEGNPLTQSELGSADIPAGSLSPHPVFRRGSDGRRASGVGFDSAVDPYTFLQNGLFIDSQGRVTPAPGIPQGGATYGGKTVYRVSGTGTNAVPDPSADALTEYRVEITHTADGRLPVTEQTDGFDADRMPDAVPRTTSPLNSNAPFVESVLGSVVGNDPFSLPGRALYGLPIRPIVFDGSVRSPGLVSGVGAPIEAHAGSLFRLTPPMDPSARPTFWSVTKDGRAFLSVGGPASAYSAEAAFGSGLRLGAGATPSGESFHVEADGKITLSAARGDNVTGRGIDISSEQGAIRIYAGGAETVGGVAQRSVPSGGGEATLPGLTLEASTTLVMKAGRMIRFSAPSLDWRDVSQMNFSANTAFNVQSGDALTLTSKVQNSTTLGKAVYTFSGPKDALPTNGALRETQFVGNPATGFVGGVADRYFMLYGDRAEVFTLGNHTTAVGVGNHTTTVGVGTWTAASGPNALSASPAGVNLAAGTGVATITAAGAASMVGGASTLVASVGPTTARGAVVILSASGGKAGGIVSGADLDPITGLPLVLLGMGSFTQVLAPA